MKKFLTWLSVAVLLLAIAFGAGWWLAHSGEEEALRQKAAAQAAEKAARQELARSQVTAELCRAAAEAARSNFGHAAERLGAAREAAKGVPELAPSIARMEEALTAAHNLDSTTHEKIESLMNETAHPGGNPGGNPHGNKD